MNSDVPKMNKKFRQDRKIPKRDIKMFKNGKNRRKGLFWGAKFSKVKSIGGSPRLGYRHTLGSKKILGIYFFVEKKFFSKFTEKIKKI